MFDIQYRLPRFFFSEMFNLANLINVIPFTIIDMTIAQQSLSVGHSSHVDSTHEYRLLHVQGTPSSINVAILTGDLTHRAIHLAMLTQCGDDYIYLKCIS